MYGNTFDGIYWAIPFAEQVRYPLSEYGDFGPRPQFDTVGGQKSSTNHKGLDLNPKNAHDGDYYILATRAGTVTSVGGNATTGAGYYVYIDHGDGYKSHYFHIKEGSFLVKKGDKVAQGQQIAIRGTTGSSTGKHLHFGITKSGTVPSGIETIESGGSIYVDPEPILFGGKGNGSSTNTIPGTVNSALLNTDKGKVWTYLTGKFNACAAAGIMGNIECESNFRPNNMQDSYASKYDTTDEKYTQAVDDGTYRYGSYSNARDSFANDSAGYGLIQWTYYTIKEALYDNAKAKNVSIADMTLQCDELYRMMDKTMSYSDNVFPDGYDATTWTKEKNLRNELTSSAFVNLSSTDAYAAVKYATALFLFEIERCADYQNKIELRFGHSKPIYDEFKDLGCKHENTRRKGTVVATCTEKGYTGDEICVACGTQLEKGEDIPATGHFWDYSYGGEVCSVCSYVNRYPIGGATPDTAKMKRVHNVLRDILVRKNDTVVTEEQHE